MHMDSVLHHALVALTCASLPGLQQAALTGFCLQGSPYQVQTDYLIAADGASSRVRKQLGIDMVGEAAMQHLVNIHFFSKDLWQHVKERPAMLYFVFSNQAIVVLVAHNLQEGEMVAQVSDCFESVPCLADCASVWWFKIAKMAAQHVKAYAALLRDCSHASLLQCLPDHVCL